MYDRWFTIALLTSEFGQVWAKLGLQKSCTTLGEITRLHNCAVADKGSIDEYCRDLGKSGQSWDYKNRTIAQLCSCRHNATAVA